MEKIEPTRRKTPIEIAQDNYNDTVELKNTIGTSYFIMGKLLTENKRNGLYKLLGHQTFEAYLATPEISFHRTTAYKHMKVYSELIEYYKIKEADLQGIDQDKLYLILPYVDKTNIQDWLEKARTLSRSDLRVAIQGKKQKQLLAAGSEWLVYSDVWEKTQPISRWGKNPHQTIFGQFVANLINYYTEVGEKVAAAGIPDTVVRDVAKEFKRDYEEVAEGADIALIPDAFEADLGIAMTSNLSLVVSQYIPNVVVMFKKLVKKGGTVAFYMRGAEINESEYTDFVTGIESISMGEFASERLIIIRENPDAKKVNLAIKDKTLNHSFERIVIFKRDGGTN